MAEWLDVAARLEEGQSAVDHTENYVRACRQIGCASTDLAIRDHYESEDGLDLRALDRDCAELRAAGSAVLEALRIQRGQVAELAAAWTGPGADAAVAFLQRHCDTASAVATELRATAQRCESLRDNLWRLVDEKVAAAIAIDDRSLAQRPEWLAAAATVSTGVGDLPTAQKVVREQINPHVHNDIGGDWLNTMRSVQMGVAAYYDMVNDRLAGVPRASFEMPDDFGPVGLPARVTPTSAEGPSAPMAHLALPGRRSAPAISGGLPAMPAAPPPAATTSPLPQPLSSPGNVGLPASANGLGGLGGLAGRIVDAMGGALGRSDDPGDDAQGDDGDTEHEHKHKRILHSAKDNKDETEDEPPGEQVPAATASRAVGPPPSAAGVPVAETQVATPPAPVQVGTPCDIAADELPKAGQ